MLIFLTFLILAAIGITVTVLFKTRRSLSSNNSLQLETEPPYRSLFEPDEEDFRAFEREETSRADAARRAAEKRAAAEKLEKIKNFQNVWQAEPDRRKTVELLRLAAESENGEIFARISLLIIEFSNVNRIKNLPPEDLADLLDSHFRTLPQQERTSGALFRVREEISALRRQNSEVRA